MLQYRLTSAALLNSSGSNPPSELARIILGPQAQVAGIRETQQWHRDIDAAHNAMRTATPTDPAAVAPPLAVGVGGLLQPLRSSPSDSNQAAPASQTRARSTRPAAAAANQKGLAPDLDSGDDELGDSSDGYQPDEPAKDSDEGGSWEEEVEEVEEEGAAGSRAKRQRRSGPRSNAGTQARPQARAARPSSSNKRGARGRSAGRGVSAGTRGRQTEAAAEAAAEALANMAGQEAQVSPPAAAAPVAAVQASRLLTGQEEQAVAMEGQAGDELRARPPLPTQLQLHSGNALQLAVVPAPPQPPAGTSCTEAAAALAALHEEIKHRNIAIAVGIMQQLPGDVLSLHVMPYLVRHSRQQSASRQVGLLLITHTLLSVCWLWWPAAVCRPGWQVIPPVPQALPLPLL
jgi:hypothetical protein